MLDNPRMSTVKIITVLSSIALSFSVCAATLEGKVIAIHDGDTLTVLVDKKQIKVRLADIDAPELKQAFGTRSRQSLAEICFKQPATIETTGRDRYGRTIGQVVCNGVDANAAQIHRGMAWVFERYAKPASPLWQLQDKARRTKAGLWADPQSVEPWTWRARGKMPNKGV